MKRAFVFWVEEYFYTPRLTQKLLAYLLLPLSWIYCFVVYIRYKLQKPREFGIPIVSVGNLTVGGSGKTPLVTALARKAEQPAVILRGYGRKSKGMVIVKEWETIVCDVTQSGDEAMIYAKKLPHAVVIVSEDRGIAIEAAKQMGVKSIFLDDAYSKHNIAKKDILIEVDTPNNFCLPSGPYREKLWSDKDVVIFREGRDFRREVHCIDPTPRMVFVTAIARPQRVDPYLPEGVIAKYYFEDHHHFTKEELEAILQKEQASSLLVTLKDLVKIETFALPTSLLDLEVILLTEQ